MKYQIFTIYFLLCITKVIAAFEEYFKDAVKSRVPLLDRIMRYIVNRKGKQLRPKFVLLSAKLGGDINISTLRAASLVELLHTATLVHDDVVDDATKRRGFFQLMHCGKIKWPFSWVIIFYQKGCCFRLITM